MTTQIQIRLIAMCNFIDLALAPGFIPGEPTSATALDYGFDFDEEELGKELLAPLPVNILEQPSYDVSAEEFDAQYRWFNS